MSETNGRAKQRHQGRKTDREVNTLTGAEKFKLWSELVTAKNELSSIRADYIKAAEMMTSRLGFKVTRNNVRDAVNQGIVAWEFSSNRLHGSAGQLLTAQVQQLSDNVKGLCGQIENLSSQLQALTERVAATEDIILRLCEASGTGTRVKKEPMMAPDAWVSK